MFNFVLHQLLGFDRCDEYHGGPQPLERVQTLAEADTDWRTQTARESWTMQTVCGQRLPAWLTVHYRPGGDYDTPAAAAAHDEEICNVPGAEFYDAEPVCDGARNDPACHLEVSIDSTNGFRGPDGMRCDHLHGVVLARLGEWLAGRGIAWKWRTEYTGEIHVGADGVDRLLESGEGANAWFDLVAWPAIVARITDQQRQDRCPAGPGPTDGTGSTRD